MSFPTFSPTINPSFPYSEDHNVVTDSIQMHKGYDETRARLIRPLRTVALNWKAVNEDQRDYILSFVAGLEGSRGPFWWTPHNKVPTPSGMDPTLSETSGGALSSRTYYVVFTWYDSSNGETKQSGQSSMTLSANHYLEVEVPPIPAHVGGWRLYAHETSGSECLQATITTGRSWTQSAALSTGTATPPSSNTLNEPVKWLLAEGVQCKKITANRWQMGMRLVEQIL